MSVSSGLVTIFVSVSLLLFLLDITRQVTLLATRKDDISVLNPAHKALISQLLLQLAEKPAVGTTPDFCEMLNKLEM